MNTIRPWLLVGLFLPISLFAQTEISVEDALKDRKPEDTSPLKMSNGYFRLNFAQLDSAFSKLGFEFRNARKLNDFMSSKSSGQFPVNVGLQHSFGAEVGFTGFADDLTGSAHFHLNYYQAGSAHTYSVGASRATKNYVNPIPANVNSQEVSIGSDDDIALEGYEFETWKEFYFFSITQNPYFRYFGLRLGLGLSTDKSRIRGIRVSSIETSINGTPNTNNYYPGVLPSGPALRLTQQDYRQTDLYAIVGLSYRAPIGRHHEIDASAESLLFGLGGGYYSMRERLMPLNVPATSDSLNYLMFLSHVGTSDSLEGAVGSILTGVRFKAGYTYKTDNNLGFRIGVGQTRKNYTMYTPNIKPKDEDKAASLALGDISDFIFKSTNPIGVSKVKVVDLRQDVSIEVQARF
ncbi:MAG: hypothetical protein H3C43_07290 [Leptonema sp. (in: Bacteria)]|nr:hypothetical protein [Leptonema sp. (in: bacteria)]